MKLRIALGVALWLGVVGAKVLDQGQRAFGGWDSDVILRNDGDLARLIGLLNHPTARPVLDRMSAAQSLWFVDSIPVSPTDSLQFRFGFGSRSSQRDPSHGARHARGREEAVGQLEGGSQNSPDSTTLLPH